MDPKVVDGDDDFEGAYQLANTIVRECKEAMEDHALEMALLLLREAADKAPPSDDTHSIAVRALGSALLARYALHGFPEDLMEASLKLLSNSVDLSGLSSPMVHQDTVVEEELTETHLALEFMNGFRRSASMANLNNAAYLYELALSSSPFTHPVRPSLLLAAANTNCLRNAFEADVDVLDLAIAQLEEALRCAGDGDRPITFCALLSLANTYCMKSLQDCNLKYLMEAFGYLKQALESDGEALKLDTSGRGHIEKFREGGNLRELELGIAQLKESVLRRLFPHPHRYDSLISLAAALNARFERQGGFEDLEGCIKHLREALQLRPYPNPDQSSSLSNLGNMLRTRFERRGGFADLEESIKLHRDALGLRLSPHPYRWNSLNNLGNALGTRFKHRGDSADLEESIKLHREALELQPSLLDRSKSLNNLANALSDRFERQGGSADLEECIRLHREALGLRPPLHPDRSSSLNNLANALSIRFKRQGDSADLEESIQHHYEALGLRPSPHRDRSSSLSNLGTALNIRFSRQGSSADLEECIKFHREALELRPIPHPDRPSSLSNLGNALSIRFKHQGGFAGLEESIKLHREALELRPSPHPDRAGPLSNLAMVLSIRFERQGNSADLEECIGLHREALRLRLSPHPDRHISLNNLATALGTRFERLNDPADLEESIKLHREALRLFPSTHPDRPSSLSNLGNALKARFEHQGDLGDLEECIQLHRETLRIRPPPHPDRSNSLNNLALALLAYDKGQQVAENQAEAFSLLEQSASYSHGSLFQRLRTASGNWARSATRLNHPSALSAYQCAINLLPQLASIHLDPQRRQDVLVHAKDLASDATRCAIEAGRFEDAVAFSSTARAVFWSHSLQLRVPSDELQLVAPHLAEKLQSLGHALEKRNLPGMEYTGTAECVTTFNDKHTTYFRGLAENWQQTLEEVREHPGFEDFCKPPSFSSLRDCSKRGPVVLLNASARGCDALVITQDSGPCHVPLHGMTLNLLVELSGFLHDLIAGKPTYAPTFLQNRDVTDSDQCRKLIRIRQGRINPEDQFALLLGILWVFVVSPVIDLLKLEKTENPAKRIWWCPSGAFSFLPIHAAGTYNDSDSVCLHDYAVSSYCSSLQNLLTPVAPIEPDYKFLAIIEPQVSGACSLPMTKVELEKIEAHLPQPHSTHLLKHVGVAGSPTAVNDVLSDLGRASFVHFGCHGKQERNPLESSLLLSGGELTMSSILQCQASKAALAYLSACQTAKHDKDRPDESLHLAATMMFAGFRSVVATLWSIYDRDAPVVADAFYGHLFRHGSTQVPDGTESAYALHLGVKALRDRGVGFLHWVPFVHYGL